MAPLTNQRCLLWEWDQAFANAKLLSTASVLKGTRLDSPFKIQVDTSQDGAGAVLMQVDDHTVHWPSCFWFLQKAIPPLWAWAAHHFDVYVDSGTHPVVAYSDHDPLTFLHSLQNLNQCVGRCFCNHTSCKFTISVAWTRYGCGCVVPRPRCDRLSEHVCLSNIPYKNDLLSKNILFLSRALYYVYAVWCITECRPNKSCVKL